MYHLQSVSIHSFTPDHFFTSLFAQQFDVLQHLINLNTGLLHLHVFLDFFRTKGPVEVLWTSLSVRVESDRY